MTWTHDLTWTCYMPCGHVCHTMHADTMLCRSTRVQCSAGSSTPGFGWPTTAHQLKHTGAPHPHDNITPPMQASTETITNMHAQSTQPLPPSCSQPNVNLLTCCLIFQHAPTIASSEVTAATTFIANIRFRMLLRGLYSLQYSLTG